MDSSDEPRPWAWLGPIADALERLDVPWVVAGALAADRYRATTRYTADLDLLVGWDQRIPGAAGELGYDVLVITDPGEPPHLLRLRSATERVDLIIASVAYQWEALGRGSADHILTVEDVIIHKLIAWRLKDRDDVAAILATRPDLDEGYLDEWISAWELKDRWAEARGG